MFKKVRFEFRLLLSALTIVTLFVIAFATISFISSNNQKNSSATVYAAQPATTGSTVSMAQSTAIVALPTVLSNVAAGPQATPDSFSEPTESAPTAEAGHGSKGEAGVSVASPLQHRVIDGLMVWYYIPQNPSNKPLQVLLALHGMYGNGNDFGLPLLPFAETHHLLLIAPTFNYNPDYVNPNIIVNEDLRFVPTLQQIVKDMQNISGYQLKPELLLYGFSRGAQLVSHFTQFDPKQVLGAATLSGGAYTLPYVTWEQKPMPFPYGVSDLVKYLDHNFDYSDYQKVHFDVEVGALDTNPSPISRNWDKYMGTDRLVRNANFYKALRDIGANAEFTIVPATGHVANASMRSVAENFFQKLLAS